MEKCGIVDVEDQNYKKLEEFILAA